MSNVLLNQGASTKRPANAWFWSIVAALLVLAVWGFFALTSRPNAEMADKEPVKLVAAPAHAPIVAPAPAPAPAPHDARTPEPPQPALLAVAPARTMTPANSASLLAEAQRMKAEDDYQGAREKLEQLLAASPSPEAEELLGEIHIALLMSPRQMPEKTEYAVQPGDSLDKIARKFDTSIGLIMKGNNLSRSMVRINDRLRVFSGKFSVKVDKSDNTLTVLMNDKFFKHYRVGSGQYNKTPVGAFKVTDKILQPTWWRPDGKAIPYGDPENLLGTHWLALDIPGYGIHGTWETNTIGKQSSAGCIRLLNENIEELYIMLPLGTPVTIVD